MGACIYCGEPAGFLHKAHPDCKTKHELALRALPEYFKIYIESDVSIEETKALVEERAKQGLVKDNEIHSIAAQCFAAVAKSRLETGILTIEDESKLVHIQREFHLAQSELGGAIELVAKAATLRDLANGVVQPRMHIEDLSITLQKNEQPIWIFNDTRLLELHQHSRYVGGSRGMSFRIARGVYYHFGAAQGRRVQEQEFQTTGIGSLIITNQNLCFSSVMKAMRIKLNKIVSVTPFSDAIEVFREAANPKPLVFKVNDPWFATNLILKLGALAE